MARNNYHGPSPHRESYQNGNFQGYSNQSAYKAPPKKKSGAKFGTTKKGGSYVSGWNVSKRRGFMSLIAFPMTDKQLGALAKLKGAKRSEFEFEVKSKTGKVWERWAYQIQNTTTGEFFKGSAFFDRSELKLRIPRFGMVASCKKNYFGTGRKPKNGQ